EALLLVTLGFAIFATYVEPGQAAIYLPTIGITVIATNVALNLAGTHRISTYRSFVQQMARVLAGWSAVFIALMTLAFLFKGSDLVSRVWLVGWYVSGALMLVAFRLSLRQLVQQWTADGKLK